MVQVVDRAIAQDAFLRSKNITVESYDALLREWVDGQVILRTGRRIPSIRPMGGVEGDASPSGWRLSVSGEVEQPFTLDMAELLKMQQVDQTCDVHCVTKWTVLDAKWTGVKLAELAARAKVKPSARHVIFEGYGGYTANVRLADALAPNVMLAHKYEGQPLARAHGAPARIIVPDLYFWKSTKWITGVRFVASDKPGYWETRGYHNHADPWKEERYG